MTQHDKEVEPVHQDSEIQDTSEVVGSPKTKKKHKHKTNLYEEVNTTQNEQVTNTEENAGVKQKKKKKHKSDGFVVEPVNHAEPSQLSTETNGDASTETPKKRIRQKINSIAENSVESSLANNNKIKRKADTNIGEQPNQKKKKGNKKDPKKIFQQNDKFKNKNKFTRPMNPMVNLSDERLKAYGLNPKKYKNFMKFKKF